MTHQEILEKAIQTAIEGGWKPVQERWLYTSGYWSEPSNAWIYYEEQASLFEVIFSHDFAKALWSKSGTAKMHYSYPIRWRLFKDDELHPTTALLEEWQYHLQQMVIADDPVKYLGDNL